MNIREQVVNCLSDGNLWTVDEIAEAIAVDADDVDDAIQEMWVAGAVSQTMSGAAYRLVGVNR